MGAPFLTLRAYRGISPARSGRWRKAGGPSQLTFRLRPTPQHATICRGLPSLESLDPATRPTLDLALPCQGLPDMKPLAPATWAFSCSCPISHPFKPLAQLVHQAVMADFGQNRLWPNHGACVCDWFLCMLCVCCVCVCCWVLLSVAVFCCVLLCFTLFCCFPFSYQRVWPLSGDPPFPGQPLSRTTSAGQPLTRTGPLPDRSPGPLLPRTAQNFVLFFRLPPPISFFFLLFFFETKSTQLKTPSLMKTNALSPTLQGPENHAAHHVTQRVSPSAPTAARISRSDLANALAAAQDRIAHQSRPSSGANQLWIRALFPPPGSRQRRPIRVSRARSCRPVAMQRGNQGRVDRQLCASEERQPISDDLQPSRISRIWNRQVHIPDHDVGRDSCSSFTTDPRSCALHRETSSSQDPCPSASCSVVTTGIEWTATPAIARGQRQTETKTTQ